MRRKLTMILLLVLAVVPALAAQRAETRLTPWEPPPIGSAPVQSMIADRQDSLAARRMDYRYEGLVVGGLTLGVLGAWIGSEIKGPCPTVPGARCDTDEVGSAIALGLVGAAVGSGLGYLVGRFSPKVAPPPGLPGSPAPTLSAAPDSVFRRVGYQHWRGAGVGIVAGSVLGAITGLVAAHAAVCDDCTDEKSAGWTAVRVGLLGAGAGGVVGFLAGLSSPKYAWVSRSHPLE
jgi:hypothetical protein